MSAPPEKYCRHRGRFVAPRGWMCSSPKVVAPGGLVSREMCDQQCLFVDHPPDPRFTTLSIGRQRIEPSVAAARQRLPLPTIRNCIYHVCPLLDNDVWRQNVKQLLKRAAVFNGRRIAAIATGPGMLAPQEVKQAFASSGFSFLEIPNDKWLREVASFLPLLEAVDASSPDQATFYAHTKGNSTGDNRTGAAYWRNAAYHYLLDHCSDAMDLLQEYACVGIHKISWPVGAVSPYPSRLPVGNWMLAGTFFWFRNDLVFGHPNWRNVPFDRYGAEAWPSSLFTVDQAFSMYQLWPETMYPNPSPYDPQIYDRPYEDDDVDGTPRNPESSDAPSTRRDFEDNTTVPVAAPSSSSPQIIGDVRFSEEIQHRTKFARLCNSRQLLGVACEIGVHLGAFAQQFLSQWQGRRYLAVDSYLPHRDVPGDRLDHRQRAHDLLAPFSEQVSWIETDSLEALRQLEQPCLDFCYIDAAHHYDAVRAEIAAAWPRIKPGGILAGHDYVHTNADVIRAVREFSLREKITILLTEDTDGPWSWYCFKPAI